MIFIENKYTTFYYQIIDRALSRTLLGYKEKHHIIPRSLGGSDAKHNLAILTGREHYLVHWLLIKMTEGENRSKMLYAFWLMNNNRKYRITSRTYAMIKQENSKSHSERMRGENNPFYGKHHTRETVAEIKARNKLQKWTPERLENWKGRMVGENNPMFGRSHSSESKIKMSQNRKGNSLTDEQRNAISEKLKGRPLKVNDRKTICPHCNRELDLGNAARHHFDNCKMNPSYIPKPKRTYNRVK